MNQGQTGPYLCVGNNGMHYIVKGPNTTYRGLIREFVCGKLGKAIGLPVPDFEIVYVDRSLLEYGNYELSEGDWFASKYEENIQDVPYQRLSDLDANGLKLLFLFDYWIKNDDRTLTESGGNPNLFIRSDLTSFIVLDHNLAFAADYDDCFEERKNLHVSASIWFSQQMSLFDKENYEELLGKCFEQLDPMLDAIPDEWLENCGDDGIVDGIRVTLARFKTAEFWEGIK